MASDAIFLQHQCAALSPQPCGCRFPLAAELDLVASHTAQISGPGDPSAQLGSRRVVRCARTPEGPATLECVKAPGELRCRAWGPGAEWALERAAAWCGLADDPPEEGAFSGRFLPLARAGRGLRLLRSPRIVDLLVLIVLEQLVSGKEARRSHHALLRRHSESAPGPFAGLWLPVAPATLASLAPAELMPLGIAPRRTEVLREIGFRATRLESLAERSPEVVEAGLRTLRGVGVWTARSLLLRGLGDADAVPVGDYHLPQIAAHHLGTAGSEHEADDERMLELLAPAAGQRGRVVMWLHHAGTPPRRAPRAQLRALPANDPPRGWFDS